MANLNEVSDWTAGIYQLEEEDPVQGGAGGIDNLQAQQLANRTAYLKWMVEALSIGKQPLDPTLTALADLVGAADKLAYFSGSDTVTLTTLTAFARTLLDDADAAAARTTLGAAALASPAFSGIPTAPTPSPETNTTQLATTAFVQALLEDLTGFQPLDATLTALASLIGTADKLAYFNGEDTVAMTTLTAFARTLLDDADAAAARNTLGAPGLDQVVPPGTVIHFAASSAPSGYLKANGAAISRSAYADLFAAIGTTFGTGDGVLTFNLPDLRSEFIRGWADGRDGSVRTIGSWEDSDNRSHNHSMSMYWISSDTGGSYSRGQSSSGGQGARATTSTGDTEARPRNVALLACVKY